MCFRSTLRDASEMKRETIEVLRLLVCVFPMTGVAVPKSARQDAAEARLQDKKNALVAKTNETGVAAASKETTLLFKCGDYETFTNSLMRDGRTVASRYFSAKFDQSGRSLADDNFVSRVNFYADHAETGSFLKEYLCIDDRNKQNFVECAVGKRNWKRSVFSLKQSCTETRVGPAIGRSGNRIAISGAPFGYSRYTAKINMEISFYTTNIHGTNAMMYSCYYEDKDNYKYRQGVPVGYAEVGIIYDTSVLPEIHKEIPPLKTIVEKELDRMNAQISPTLKREDVDFVKFFVGLDFDKPSAKLPYKSQTKQRLSEWYKNR